MQATLYSQAGTEVGTIELDEYIFGIKPNVPVMHQMMVLQQANARQGTSNTRTRGQVRGSTRKIYRQKGTGRRARVPSAPPSLRWWRCLRPTSAQVHAGHAEEDASTGGAVGVVGQAS